MKNFKQQPTPVPPQVEIPQEFPGIPQAILDRFPEATDWQRRLDDFWTRTNQAIQQAQDQTARQVNGNVVFSVDTFLIYQGDNPVPMFSLDDTGVRIGNVLVVDTPGSKMYIGAGDYADDNTPFYVDTLGKFSLGANLTWEPDTATLTITGTIIATSGSIGGFDIGTDYIRDVANSFGLASTITGGDDVRLWAGSTFANRATAPFRVTEAGLLFATGATITGSITATSGAIGGFDIGTDYIRDAANSMGLASTVTGGDDVRFWAGNTFANRATAPFRVTEAGLLVATSATISGAITATTGSIGGFDVGADYIRDTANSFGLASTITGGDDIRFWAGATFANRALAPVKIMESGDSAFGVMTLSGILSSSANGQFLTAATSSLAVKYLVIGNTGSSLFLGIESNAGGTVTGAANYQSFLTTTDTLGLVIGVNLVAVGIFATTGLTLPGTLSAVGGVRVSTSSTSLEASIFTSSGASGYIQSSWTMDNGGTPHTFNIAMQASGGGVIGTATNDALIFRTNGTARLTISASASTFTGGAGNMILISGTGNSRTMAFQTTTSGGVATTVLTLNADQSATFAGGISGTTLTASGLINSTSTGAVFYALGATTAARAILFSNTGNTGTYFGIENSAGSYFGATAYDAGISTAPSTGFSVVVEGTGVIQRTTSSGVAVNGTVSQTGKTATYNNVATAGWGVPAIYAAGRVTAQSAANASISTYTVGAADGSFEISANMNVTASTVLTTTLTCTYTDESNTARSMILPVTSLAGTFVTAGAITGAGATVWSTPVQHIRCKAATVITILTSAGTFTGVTYTAEGIIKQTN